MVRLKGLRRWPWTGRPRSISIPYGAIKRRAALCCQAAEARISIPYGAIKSSRRNAPEGVAAVFQFLMVRLKVLHHV